MTETEKILIETLKGCVPKARPLILENFIQLYGPISEEAWKIVKEIMKGDESDDHSGNLA